MEPGSLAAAALPSIPTVPLPLASVASPAATTREDVALAPMDVDGDDDDDEEDVDDAGAGNADLPALRPGETRLGVIASLPIMAPRADKLVEPVAKFGLVCVALRALKLVPTTVGKPDPTI